MIGKNELLRLFQRGVESAGAEQSLSARLPADQPSGRTIVLGCGKAAAAMAEVAHATLKGDVVGCVVTRYGHGSRGDTGNIEVIEASHPVPDEAGRQAGRKILKLAETAGPDDRVIFLISGGGSALLSAPAPGLSLHQKAEVTDFLVKSGAPIQEINLVRRHLSAIKGGRLAAAAGARGADLHTFIISDVVGDDPANIASGPTVYSKPAPDEALAILERYGFAKTRWVEGVIRSAACVAPSNHPVTIIATAKTALLAIDNYARELGWHTHWLGATLSGDARDIGRKHAEIVSRMARRHGKHLLLSGGELTVRVTNPDGKGGPNATYLAALMQHVEPELKVAALAGDSDGIDGSEDNAGAWFDPDHRASPEECNTALDANLSYELFRRTGGLVMTGPTRTNVNDLRIIAVEGTP